MRRFASYFRFFGFFTLLYSLLIVPVWFGFGDTYAGFFRVAGAQIFHDNDVRELNFQPLKTLDRPYSTRIEIANRTQLNMDDSGPVRHLDFDTMAFGWAPTALILALVMASPVSWKRRLWALISALFLEHFFLILFLGFLIWHESIQISLVTLTPFWTRASDRFADWLTEVMSFAIPVCIWALVTFRREDHAHWVQILVKAKAPSGAKC